MSTRIAILTLVVVSVAVATVAVSSGRKGYTTVPEGLPIKFDRVKFGDGKAVLKWQRTGTWEELEAAVKKIASERDVPNPSVSIEWAGAELKPRPFDPARPIRGFELRVIPRDTFAGAFHMGELIKILPDTESGSLFFYADNWGTKYDAYFVARLGMLLYDEDLAPPP